MSWFRVRRDRRIADLNARLTVIAAERNAARDRASRLERDLATKSRLLDAAKETSAIRRGRIEHLEIVNDLLEHRVSELEEEARWLQSQLAQVKPGIAIYPGRVHKPKQQKAGRSLTLGAEDTTPDEETGE